MNINDKKNIIATEKILLIKQYAQYAKLCKIYEKLALTCPLRNADNDEIRDRYAKALSNASKGDVDFLTNNKTFTPNEATLIAKYAQTATMLKFYGKATTILDQAITFKNESKNISPKNIASIDPKKITEFHNYLQTSGLKGPITLDEALQDHSRKFLSFQYYQVSKKAIRTVNDIDESHIPSNLKNVSPASFGIKITGARGRIGKVPTNISLEEPEMYHNALKSVVKHIYTDPLKKSIIKHTGTTLAVALAAMTAFQAASSAKTHYEVNSINNNVTTIEEAQKYGIDQNLPDLLVARISNLQKNIDSASKSNTIIENEQLASYKNEIDELFNEIVEQKFIQAFKEKYPKQALIAQESAQITGKKPFEVGYSYDFSADPESPYHLSFSYLDKAKEVETDGPYGTSKVYIADQKSIPFSHFGGKATEVFENEVDIDKFNTTINPDAPISERAQSQDKIIEQLQGYSKFLTELANSNPEITRSLLGRKFKMQGISDLSSKEIHELYKSIKNPQKDQPTQTTTEISEEEDYSR